MDKAINKKIKTAIQLLEQVAVQIDDPEKMGEILAGVEECVALAGRE
jgi:hypothetical protein